MEGCTDGTWHKRRYFTCAYGRGFFTPYYNLLPDCRSKKSGNAPWAAPAVNRKEVSAIVYSLWCDTWA